jgi:hypothetical protein
MVVKQDRFDVVNATTLPADFLDHSYYATNHSMLSDIYCLLRGSPAAIRPLIEASGVNWSFRSEEALKAASAKACDGKSSVLPTVLFPSPSSVGHKSWWLTGSISLGALIALLAGVFFLARRRRRS